MGDLFKLGEDYIAGLEDMVSHTEQPHVPDLLLVGDGSATVYDKAGGWACVYYDRIKKEAYLLFGSITGCTNYFAEMMPYVHALWYHDQSRQKQQGGIRPHTYKVTIVSDNETTVRCGNGIYRRKANAALWAMISAYEKENGGRYKIHWHHIHRETDPWNSVADNAANEARKSLLLLIDKLKERSAEVASSQLKENRAAIDL